jgi:cupin fold WbuC family metalloprotein
MTKAIHANTLIVKVTQADVLRDYIAGCLADPDNRYRFCANESPNDPLHEMLIAHTDKTIVPIHRHHNKSESFHWIVGYADVLIYDDAGQLSQTIPMGPYDSGRVFYYRLNADLYHSLRILSPVVVFHEVTDGPWHKEDLIIAPFWKEPEGWSR